MLLYFIVYHINKLWMQFQVESSMYFWIFCHKCNWFRYISLTLLTRAKCGTHSTLCWKVGNISGSTELFAL